MFFILSKSVALFLLPSNLLIAIGLAGLILLAIRRKRAGICMVASSLILLALVGFLPIGSLLIHALESRFPPWDPGRGPPDGIVVLGGAITPNHSRDSGEPVIGGDAGRIIAMAKLSRAYPNARIVYSGGDASLLGNQAPETDFVYPLLDSLGVPRNRVLLESRSRNTAENALFTKELVKPKPTERWLLVTSARHMPRAVGCFRRVGFPIGAFPVGWRTSKNVDVTLSRTFAAGLAQLDSATYEWAGLFAYWITGRTDEFFPSPTMQ